jgi:hypothetical protein
VEQSILNNPLNILRLHLKINVPNGGGNSETSTILELGHLNHLPATE